LGDGNSMPRASHACAATAGLRMPLAVRSRPSPIQIASRRARSITWQNSAASPVMSLVNGQRACRSGMLLRVGQKSRSRKPAKASQRQSGGPNRAHAFGKSRRREPAFRDACDTLITSMELLADPSEIPDAYSAESLVSVLLGMMIQAGAHDRLSSALLDLTDELYRRDVRIPIQRCGRLPSSGRPRCPSTPREQRSASKDERTTPRPGSATWGTSYRAPACSRPILQGRRVCSRASSRMPTARDRTPCGR
jgi:hypothetical protein